ncbi:MAG: hypothetical protein Q8K97_07540 [Pseudohongiella sp.]|nr:hypothetical protein [Pseudohongiella sp.]
MKNKFLDLNNHLFTQLERLNDESLKGEKLVTEINRAKAVAGVANQIVSTGRLVLDAQVAHREHQLSADPLLSLSSPSQDKVQS